MDPARSPRRGRVLLAATVAAALLLLGAFAAGRLSAPVPATPSTTSVEAGFARDMQTHHHQAVEMSLIVRDLTDDPDIRLLAYDIATSQSQQAGQMYGWLSSWGVPQASAEPAMTWMTRPALDGSSHGHETSAPSHGPGGTMPGMASAEDLAGLKALRGAEAERLFLELMIAHHEGGVEMAEALLARSEFPVVTQLARGILKAQSSEIDYMRGLLARR